VATAILVVAGCGGSVAPISGSPRGGDAAVESAEVAGGGTISAQVELPAGMVVASSAYVLTGPGQFYRSATLLPSGTRPVTFAIAEVPPGSGYTLDVTAVAAGGAQSCDGSAMFDIAGMETAFVTLFTQCSISAAAAAQLGSVQVAVTVPSGALLSTVAYVLESPDGTVIQGDVDVAGTFVINDVRAGSGVKLALSGTSPDGAESCTAESLLDVAGGQTSRTTLALACARPASPAH
jgi:hypothetical protein